MAEMIFMFCLVLLSHAKVMARTVVVVIADREVKTLEKGAEIVRWEGEESLGYMSVSKYLTTVENRT